MSFGRPQGFSDIVSTPPDRGAFPLDHYGECKEQMKAYLACLKKNAATSTPCRTLNKDYLECRMSKGLMQRDDWHSLGLENVPTSERNSSPSSPSASSSEQKDPPESKQEGRR
ncbi:hypothetical protein A7U60_g1584 [Sanghuangporus baumii]|uniref:Cytochrome c oxidase assembly protein COX19 n=1 Tax=Sanghuangporus baumii TaxID=108892 RepID=A0A9Q5I437_SANBA|nr:hypothetical protein A7U60_g1584 [Sanghuangporus baumii]